MMDLMKTARTVYGSSGDNFVDKAGFTSLAAMLYDIKPVSTTNALAKVDRAIQDMLPKNQFKGISDEK
jgi:hypothetical protein